jgi:hypothetical protein
MLASRSDTGTPAKRWVIALTRVRRWLRRS